MYIDTYNLLVQFVSLSQVDVQGPFSNRGKKEDGSLVVISLSGQMQMRTIH